jgi:tetratricopeptide (TPR) repeat protein
MDPNNPVVKLCAQGMEEETKGNVEQAAKLFEQAWTQSSDEFERCIAAHYVARHQTSGALALYWNQEAMDCASRVNDDIVAEFFPSLHLNLGKSLEDVGKPNEAKEHYQQAAAKVASLPAGPYCDIIRDGIERGLRRVSA